MPRAPPVIRTTFLMATLASIARNLFNHICMLGGAESPGRTDFQAGGAPATAGADPQPALVEIHRADRTKDLAQAATQAFFSRRPRAMGLALIRQRSKISAPGKCRNGDRHDEAA